MKNSERRHTKRFSIQVLVNCLPPGPRKRNGHPTHGWEMWARDLGDDGVRLKWTQAWASRDYETTMLSLDQRTPARRTSVPSPTSYLKKGSTVLLEDLVYGDRGSKPLKGRVQWVKPGKKGESCEFGVLITSPDHRSYFRALAA
jgi:hypothetical protein